MIWSLENSERTNVSPLSSFRFNWGIVKTPIKHLLLYVYHHRYFFLCPVSENTQKGISPNRQLSPELKSPLQELPSTPSPVTTQKFWICHKILYWRQWSPGPKVRVTFLNGATDIRKTWQWFQPSTFFPKRNKEIWLYIRINSQLFRTRYNNLMEVTFFWNIKQRSFQSKNENNLYGNFCHNPQLLFHNTYW